MNSHTIDEVIQTNMKWLLNQGLSKAIWMVLLSRVLSAVQLSHGGPAEMSVLAKPQFSVMHLHGNKGTLN